MNNMKDKEGEIIQHYINPIETCPVIVDPIEIFPVIVDPIVCTKKEKDNSNLDSNYNNITSVNIQQRISNIEIDKIVPVEIDGSRIIAENEGLVLYTEEQERKVLSNFIIQVLKVIKVDDGVNSNTELAIKIILENTQVIDKTISIEKLNQKNWIKEVTNHRAYACIVSNADRYIEIFLSKQIQNAQEEIKYNHVGWRKIDGKHVYLHSKGAIGVNSFKLYAQEGKEIEVDNTIDPKEAFRKSTSMIKVYKDFEITIPMLMYAHLSIMRSIFIDAGITPSFLLWVYGTTGSAKTSISKIFFNIFNRSKDYISASFKDTKAAIENKAFEQKDCTLLIDDLHPTDCTAEKKHMESLARYVLRIYGDNISKSRMTNTMKQQREFPPRGMAVITAEYAIGGESTISRYIGLEIERGKVEFPLLTKLQKKPLFFSTHMYYFIQWLSENYQYIKEHIQNRFSFIRDKYIQEFRHNRLTEALAILIITVEIYVEYGVNLGVINKGDDIEIIKSWTESIIKTIKNHDKAMINEDPGIMYLQALNELIGTGRCRLNKIGGNMSDNKSIIGFYDEEWLYIYPDTAFSQVMRFWKNQNIEFPINKKALHKELDRLGVIKTEIDRSNGKETVKRTIKCNPDKTKKRSRYLMIYKDKMNKVISSN
ncbi:MAG: DUF927 domain-containing protein [Clostridiaceae bacterium]|nr:DUF927 domain-containing protein [Clostridiaceae bacterium]